MQNFLMCFALSLINNIDAFGVRIAYSFKGVKIGLWHNLWIAAISFVISFISAYIGLLIGRRLDHTICGIVSMTVICGVGVYIIWSAYKPEKPDPDIDDKDKRGDAAACLTRKVMSFKEATLLGLALSVNNAVDSLGGGLAGLNSLLIGILSAILSFIAFLLGNYLSSFFKKFNLGRKATLTAGIVLILFGIKQLF